MLLLCKCGRKIEVPSLSELRRMSGHGPTLSPAVLIETMVAAGELPAMTDCAGCGTDTRNEVDVIARVERARVRDGSGNVVAKVFFVLMFGWIAYFLIRANRHPRLIGTDRDIRLPIRICQDCQLLRLHRSPEWPFLALAALLAAAGLGIGFEMQLPSVFAIGVVAGLVVAFGGIGWSRARFRKNMRRLLRSEPVYGRLLERYPDAEFVVLGRERGMP